MDEAVKGVGGFHDAGGVEGGVPSSGKISGMPSKYRVLNDASRLAHADLTGGSPNPEHSPFGEGGGSRRAFLAATPALAAMAVLVPSLGAQATGRFWRR